MIEDDRAVLLALKAMYERRGVEAAREVFKTEKGRSYIKGLFALPPEKAHSTLRRLRLALNKSAPVAV